jgi:large subunit ribosomal protein L13
MTHTIDAKGKTLGRTASAVAKLLMGKDKATFERHLVTGSKVNLINVGQAKISKTKLDTKTYARYSGYPGGLTKEKMSNVAARKGYAELFKLAVYGMLPANKLRPIIMKNLTVSE